VNAVYVLFKFVTSYKLGCYKTTSNTQWEWCILKQPVNYEDHMPVLFLLVSAQITPVTLTMVLSPQLNLIMLLLAQTTSLHKLECNCKSRLQ
jgi:hypothetical protein